MYVPTSTSKFRNSNIKNDDENQFLEDLKLFDDIENHETDLLTTTELIPTTTTNGFYESFTFTVAETLFPFSAVYESFDDSLKAKTESSLLYESFKKSGDSAANGKQKISLRFLIRKLSCRKTVNQSITSLQASTSQSHYPISTTGTCYSIWRIYLVDY